MVSGLFWLVSVGEVGEVGVSGTALTAKVRKRVSRVPKGLVLGMAGVALARGVSAWLLAEPGAGQMPAAKARG